MARNRDLPLPPKTSEQSGVDMPLTPPVPAMPEEVKAPIAANIPTRPNSALPPPSNTAESGAISTEGVEVVATKNAFYKNNRIKPGDRFTMPFNRLGDWVKCVDSGLEKKRVQMLMDRKAGKALPQE